MFKSRIRRIIDRINRFLVSKSDPAYAIGKIERFCRRHWILSSNTFNDYIENLNEYDYYHNNKSRRSGRKLLVMFGNVIQLLYMSKYIVPGLLNGSHIVRVVFSDANFILSSKHTSNISDDVYMPLDLSASCLPNPIC